MLKIEFQGFRKTLFAHFKDHLDNGHYLLNHKVLFKSEIFIINLVFAVLSTNSFSVQSTFCWSWIGWFVYSSFGLQYFKYVVHPIFDFNIQLEPKDYCISTPKNIFHLENKKGIAKLGWMNKIGTDSRKVFH